jgi:subtilase family serine protease
MTTYSPRLGSRVAAIIAGAATLVALSFVGAGPASAASRTTFNGSKPTWAVSANNAGTPAADTSVEGEIYLPLRNEAAAEALATAVSSPTSPLYRHSLSPSAWIAKFSPTKADSNALVSYLKGQGVTIIAVPKSREYVVFRGTVDQLNTIFSADLKTYNYSGRQLIAPSVAPSLPSSVGALVSGISIDQSRFLTHPDSIPQGSIPTPKAPQSFSKQSAPKTSPSFVVNAPCSTYMGQNIATIPAAYGMTKVDTINCGYTAAQFRSAYGVQTLDNHGVNGAGQTVAIIDAYASPTIKNDVNTFSANAGEPLLKNGQYSQIVPSPSSFADQALCQFPSGWQTEQTLDVESVHGIAPGAKVLYVGGYNCGGGLDIAASTIIDNKLANIVSNSYSDATEALPADVVAGENDLYVQAAGEGIGMYFSTGDDGDLTDLGETPQPSFPATDPFVTGVGGTSLGINKSGNIAFETGWGDQLDQIVVGADGVTPTYLDPLPGSVFGGGAGGGTSSLFTEPSYQKGVVPNSLSGGFRVSPDIAADADPYTGYMIGYRPITDDTTLATGPYQTVTYGGTSLASPLVAGQIAIVQQATHSTIGFANPTLYGLDKILPSSFRDVKHANPPVALAYDSMVSGHTWLITLDRDTSLSTANGYDNVTGIGELTYGLLTLLAAGRH